jgi:RNA polymerase sigma-70 factor (ECF subfamily)
LDEGDGEVRVEIRRAPEPPPAAAPSENIDGDASASPLRFPTRDPQDDRDAALIAAHRAGDASALAELLGHYQDRLFGVCLRMVGDHESARDLVQDAMVKIIQGLDSFDGRAKLSTWLIRVTMNACLTHLRREKLRRHASLDAPVRSRADAGEGGATHKDLLADDAEPAAAARVQRRDDLRRLSDALLRIDPVQRGIILLRDVHGLDYRQIAQVLDVPEGTVKSRLFRARLALREQVERLEKSGG